jgi:hypothetical protein
VVVTGSEYAPPVGVKVLVIGMVCKPLVEQNVEVAIGVGQSELEVSCGTGSGVKVTVTVVTTSMTCALGTDVVMAKVEVTGAE